MKVLVIQSCLTLWDPMDCSPPGSSVHADSPDNNAEVGSHSLLQVTFLTQGSNLGVPHCRQILYHLSHQGTLEGNDSLKLNILYTNLSEALY